MSVMSSAAPVRVPLLTAAQSGASKWIDVRGYTYLTVYFKTTGNPGAGTCLIEECDYDPRTQGVPDQTMSAIITVDIDTSVGTDGQFAYHLIPAAYSFVRTRIGTSVTVATLDTVLVAH